mmetsp:Transcript_735/g.1667  ORF Transcript_735/g.1667 Transcript_735/m.1667 type:complete len:200 (+) Transcript_735:446-1045(+)
MSNTLQLLADKLIKVWCFLDLDTCHATLAHHHRGKASRAAAVQLVYSMMNHLTTPCLYFLSSRIHSNKAVCMKLTETSIAMWAHARARTHTHTHTHTCVVGRATGHLMHNNRTCRHVATHHTGTRCTVCAQQMNEAKKRQSARTCPCIPELNRQSYNLFNLAWLLRTPAHLILLLLLQNYLTQCSSRHELGTCRVVGTQ